MRIIYNFIYENLYIFYSPRSLKVQRLKNFLRIYCVIINSIKCVIHILHDIDYYHDIFIRIRSCTCDFGYMRNFMKFEFFIFVLTFRQCEKRRRKISSAHRFREIRGKGKAGEERFRSSGEFLRSPYTTPGSTRSDKRVSSVCLISVFQKFRPFFHLKFPRKVCDDHE